MPEESLPTIDLDHRDALSVARLQRRVAGDIHDSDIESEAPSKPGEELQGVVTEVAAIA